MNPEEIEERLRELIERWMPTFAKTEAHGLIDELNTKDLLTSTNISRSCLGTRSQKLSDSEINNLALDACKREKPEGGAIWYGRELERWIEGFKAAMNRGNFEQDKR